MKIAIYDTSEQRCCRYLMDAVSVPSPIDYDRIATEQIIEHELQRLLCSHTGLKLELRQTPLA